LRTGCGRTKSSARRARSSPIDGLNKNIVNRVALAIVFTALVLVLYSLPFADWVAIAVQWLQQHRVAGPVVYIAGSIVATVLFLPGSVSMMLAGFLFGLLPGILFAAVSIAAGAQFAFLAGRRVARRLVEKRVAGNRKLEAIEKGLKEEAFTIVVLTRLSLIIPFNVLNYAYGVTSVTSRTHLFATALGMLPAVALYVYLGTVARDLGQILSGEGTPSELGYWIAAAGIAVIVVLTWVIHQAASRALAKHLPSLETDSAD
jgi:uncharacterized membrane protein YdjX (TVP38/TMEM64 family)